MDLFHLISEGPAQVSVHNTKHLFSGTSHVSLTSYTWLKNKDIGPLAGVLFLPSQSIYFN